MIYHACETGSPLSISPVQTAMIQILKGLSAEESEGTLRLGHGLRNWHQGKSYHLIQMNQ